MNEEQFLEHYLTPSEDHLDQRFRLPLPETPGLARQHEYIIQCRSGDTCSTNVIGVYGNADTGLKLKEVYKNQ